MKKEVNLTFIAIVLLAMLFINPNITGFATTNIEKPTITYDANSIAIITEEHINYILYSLDAEDLHKVILTSNYPEIEVVTMQKNNYFTSYVISSEIQTYKGQSLNPDIQLKIDENVIANIIKSSDPKAATKSYVDKGWIGLKVYSSNIELYFKGYWDLYDLLKP